MAKRKTTDAEGDAPITPRVRRHMAALGLARPDQYLAWCAAHGFRAATDKSHLEVETEAAAREAEADQQQRQLVIHRNPSKLIDAACRGETASLALAERPALQRFCRSIEKSRTGGDARESLARLLHKVSEETSFLYDETRIAGQRYPFVDALIKLNDRRGQWIRPLADWKPVSHNARRQFASLARHLLARFPVPEFMDIAWFETGAGSHRKRDWFAHIGDGKNIRSADTPIPMTKMMAHHFMEAPDDFSIAGAIRWGQIHALGGDKRLVVALLGTRIGNDFSHDEFWSSVIRFFIANPLLDRRHVGPIIDYLNTQKFEARDVFVPGRGIVPEPPAQPNLSMRGRSADALLEQVERWHRELGRTSAAGGLRFKPSGIKPLELVAGRDGENLWRIRELMSGAELTAEGKAMRHCVASYARSCASGHCSIWAMDFTSKSGTEKRLTIEVVKTGAIVQARGRMNRLPTAGELAIVQQWARHAHLTVSPYVRAEA